MMSYQLPLHIDVIYICQTYALDYFAGDPVPAGIMTDPEVAGFFFFLQRK